MVIPKGLFVVRMCNNDECLENTSNNDEWRKGRMRK